MQICVCTVMQVTQFRVCLWFSARGFGISDDGSIWDAGITQPFCFVLVNDGENLVHYSFFLFLFLFFFQSMLFCWRQLSALKRAKLHVLAWMSATNLVILFTHFLFPRGHFSPWKFTLLCLSSLSASLRGHSLKTTVQFSRLSAKGII